MAADVHKRIKVGDILELQTTKGLTYLQYIGKHQEYGDVILVLPKFYKSRPRELTEVVEDNGYIAFYPARAAVREGLIEIVKSHMLTGDIKIPETLRRAGARSRDGKVLSWIIEGRGKEIVYKELSEDQTQLPIAAIWDHDLLVLRVLGNWSPGHER